MVEISVIIPVYNCEEYLDESVGGILNQTFQDIEVICVDDGSTDNSLKKLQEFAKEDSRMQVFHQENQGGGAARNFALTKATGKYLYFMDADDIICPDALKKSYEVCERTDVDFLVFKAKMYIEEEDRYSENEYFMMNKLYEYVGDEVFSIEDIGDMIFKFSVTPWGKLYKRDFVMDSGAQFAVGISFHDNKFFWEMLFNSKSIIFLNEILYVRRLHSKSLIGSKNKGYFNSFIAFNIVFDIFKKYDQFDKFKTQLFNWKVRILYFRFTMIHDEFKQEFLERLQKEFQSIENEDGLEYLLSILEPRNQAIFQNALNSQTYMEYIVRMENYGLNNRLDKLNNDNKNLKKKISNLEKKYDKLNDKYLILDGKYKKSNQLNKQILNSRSWKLTKPLRKMKNIR